MERKIEDTFIAKLRNELKYVYREDIRDRKALENNFLEKFQSLNRVRLSESEKIRLVESIVSPDVFKSAKRLRERNTFIREDGTPLQYTLVNIDNWCRNTYEVVNQLRINTSNSFQRYDVIILVNGLPLVQIELKSHDVSPRRAMQQIIEYKNDSGNGYLNTLLCFVQLFIVSNGFRTFYFCNNNNRHFAFNADERYIPVYFWADSENKKILPLDKFSEQFLCKCRLGEMISKFMVLVASEQKLMIMRPYQIYAVKSIIECVEQNRGDGFIWHTTGSGKTLTSFKVATLLKDNPDIQKCFFVVDRKDLDKQTREEFNRFQEGCVEENTNTQSLVRRMLSSEYADKIIVTTIQKLNIALNPTEKNPYREDLEDVADDRAVFIFDECHRSQSKDIHDAIRAYYPDSQFFGFTGTPINDENAHCSYVTGEEEYMVTTEKLFGRKLHSYTITQAIEDENVLRFHIDYYKSGKDSDGNPEKVTKESVVNTILDKHDSATRNRMFNALLATGSINDAIEYYRLFKDIQEQRKDAEDGYEPLNVACVFSPPAYGDKDILQIQEDLPQEKADNQVEPDLKRDALTEIINDYNEQYGTNCRIVLFDKYYQDVQQRIKDQQYCNSDYPHSRKIDITIVVDMLLTGFDSKYLNTLYVDKNLKYHQLIQAFSRTNRILNDNKPYGNIIDFRQQGSSVDAAIALFSGEDVEHAKTVWLVDSADEVIKKYKEAVLKLTGELNHGLLEEPPASWDIQGDVARISFITKFKEVQRLKNRLDQYTDLTEEQKYRISFILPEKTLKEYRAEYLEDAKRLRDKRNGSRICSNSQLANVDFELVLFASSIIDYDYIMGLISRYTIKSKEKITRAELVDAISSTSNLMDEKEDILAYLDDIDKKQVNGKTEEEVKQDYEKFREDKFLKKISELADQFSLDGESMKLFINETVERLIFDGEKLDDVFSPLGLGWKELAVRESELMKELIPLLKKQVRGQEISGLSAYEE